MIAVKVFILIHLLGLDFRQGRNPCLQINPTHLNQTKDFYSKFGVAIRVTVLDLIYYGVKITDFC
jgi:hypothetical protein